MKLNSHIKNLKLDRLVSSTYSIHIRDYTGVWEWYCYVNDEREMDELLNKLVRMENVDMVRVTFDTSIKLFDAEAVDIQLGGLFKDLLGEDDDDE